MQSSHWFRNDFSNCSENSGMLLLFLCDVDLDGRRRRLGDELVTDHNNYQAAIFQKNPPFGSSYSIPVIPKILLSLNLHFHGYHLLRTPNHLEQDETQKNGWSQHISTIFRLSWWCSLELWALCRKAMHALLLSHLGRKSRLRVRQHDQQNVVHHVHMVFLMGNRNRHICIYVYDCIIYIYTYYTFITNLGCFHISLLVRVEIRWGVVGLWLAKKESKFNQEWSTPKIAWIHNTFIRALYNLWIRNPTWFFPTPRTTWPNLNKKKTGKLGRTHSQTNTNRASIKDFALSGMNDVETLW